MSPAEHVKEITSLLRRGPPPPPPSFPPPPSLSFTRRKKSCSSEKANVLQKRNRTANVSSGCRPGHVKGAREYGEEIILERSEILPAHDPIDILTSKTERGGTAPTRAEKGAAP